MAEVQEKDLGKKTTILDSEYIRFTDSNGNSVSIKKSDFKLLLTQIYTTGYTENLVEVLAEKMALSSSVSQMAFIDALGQVVGSGVNRSVIATSVELDAFFSGFATITGTLTDSVIGNIYNVLAFDNSAFGAGAKTRATQVVCSSRGIWYRVWSTTWSDYIYVGGSYDSLSLTRAQALTLIDNGKLTMGVSYRITDNGNDNGIILQAMSNTSLSRFGVRMCLFPKHYVPVTDGSNVWKGQWASCLTDANVDLGDLFVYNSRVWQSKTGNLGTVSGYGLDSTNWDLVEVVSGDFYDVVECQCEYDIRNRLNPATGVLYTKGWVFTMTDEKGNTFGSKVYNVADELSLVEYNQFHCPFVYNNTLKLCRNIRNFTGEEETVIANNTGLGEVYNLVEVTITDSTINGKMYNLKDGSIANFTQQDSLCVLKGRGDYFDELYGSSFTISKSLQGNASTIIVQDKTEFIEFHELSMTSCFVYGEVHGWGTYLRTTFGTGYSCTYLQQATDCVLNGTVGSVCYKAENVYIGAGAAIYADYIELYDVYIGEGRKYTSLSPIIRNLFIPSSAIDDGYGYNFQQTALESKITAEIERVGGTLSIPSGASFQLPTYTGTENDVRLNGVTKSGAALVAQHEGWYKVDHIISANLGGITSAVDIETAVHVNGVATNIARKVTYSNNTQWRNEAIAGSVYLSVGDSLDVRYKNTGSAITATIYTARLILTYNN